MAIDNFNTDKLHMKQNSLPFAFVYKCINVMDMFVQNDLQKYLKLMK